MKELNNFYKPPFTVKTTDRFHKEVFNTDGDHIINLEGDSTGYKCFFVKYKNEIQDFIYEVDKTELRTWIQSHIKLPIISWAIVTKL